MAVIRDGKPGATQDAVAAQSRQELAYIGTRERIAAIAGHELRYLEAQDVDRAIDAAIASGGPAPYGAVLWTSGFALAEGLLGLGLAGQTVVDLGAGCGLVSLAAATVGAHVIALEIDPVARTLLAEAARRQQLDIEVRAFDLCSTTPLPPADLLICADLLYEKPLAEATARRAFEAWVAGAEIWVGDPARIGRSAFERGLAERGLKPTWHTTEVRLPGERDIQTVEVSRSPEWEPLDGT